MDNQESFNFVQTLDYNQYSLGQNTTMYTPYNWDKENSELKLKLTEAVATVDKLTQVIKLLVETRDYGKL